MGSHPGLFLPSASFSVCRMRPHALPSQECSQVSQSGLGGRGDGGGKQALASLVFGVFQVTFPTMNADAPRKSGKEVSKRLEF